MFKFQGEHFWHHGWKHHHGWKWDFKWIYLSEVTAAPSPAFITPEDTEQVFFKAKSEVKYLFFWGCMAEKNKHIAFKIKYSVDVTTTGSSDFGVPATSVAHLEKEKYLEFPADFCGCKGNKRGKHKHKGCKFKKWKHGEFFRSLTDEVELGWAGRSDNGGVAMFGRNYYRVKVEYYIEFTTRWGSADIKLGEDVKSGEIWLYPSAPVIKLISPANGYISHNPFKIVIKWISWAPVDLSTFQVIANGEDITSAFEIHDNEADLWLAGEYFPPEGTKIDYEIYISDINGHQGSNSGELIVDTLPPAIRVINPVDGAYTIFYPVDMRIKISDYTSGIDWNSVKVYLNGKDVSEYLEPTTQSGIYRLDVSVSDTEENEIEVYGSDRAGHISSDRSIFVYNPDIDFSRIVPPYRSDVSTAEKVGISLALIEAYLKGRDIGNELGMDYNSRAYLLKSAVEVLGENKVFDSVYNLMEFCKLRNIPSHVKMIAENYMGFFYRPIRDMDILDYLFARGVSGDVLERAGAWAGIGNSYEWRVIYRLSELINGPHKYDDNRLLSVGSFIRTVIKIENKYLEYIELSSAGVPVNLIDPPGVSYEDYESLKDLISKATEKERLKFIEVLTKLYEDGKISYDIYVSLLGILNYQGGER